ncbi:MAG TPA: hypothetical protein VJP78_06555, partial [Thermoleophilia bacterium]|nr:hypothetical protein [Thermoleophilia bacterium]
LEPVNPPAGRSLAPILYVALAISIFVGGVFAGFFTRPGADDEEIYRRTVITSLDTGCVRDFVWAVGDYADEAAAHAAKARATVDLTVSAEVATYAYSGPLGEGDALWVVWLEACKT